MMLTEKNLHLTPHRKPKFFYGYVVILAALCIMAVSTGAAYTFGVFLKPMITEFGWTRATMSGAFSLATLLFGSLSILAGRLTDKLGPRIVLTACSFFLGLGYFLMSQISTIWQLYLFFGVITSLGMSGTFVPLMSTVARWFVKRRGIMTGIVLAGVGIGTVIMPPVANYLISSYGWRTSYIIIGILVLALTISAAQFLRHDPRQMGLSPYGVGETKVENLSLEVRGFSLQRAIHTGQFWMLCATYFCFSLCLQSIMVHVAPHATDLGISAASAASILAIIGGASIAGRIITGGAADRIGNKLALIVGLIMMSMALFWLIVAREAWMLYLFAIIFGLAYGGSITLFSPIVADLYGLSSHGAIFGVLTFIGTIGEAIGPVTAGSIFDITGSYNLAFLIFASVSLIAFILASLLKPTSRQTLTGNV